MTWPTIFANLAAGNQPLSLFDAMFNQVAQMVAIPSNAAGTNAITLTPIGSAPALANYQNFSSFRFVAAATSTGPVTAQYQALGFLNVYLSDGVTQASTGNVVIGQEYVLVFAQFLNGGAGGFFLEAAAVPAQTQSAGSALTNLLIVSSGLTCNVTYDELVMNNVTGGALRATAQSFTINSANVGVVNGLDTGALAANNWYAVWGISNGSTSGGLLSLSYTNPTMPAGYTFKKRIGALPTTGAVVFFAIRQAQRKAQYVLAAGANLRNFATGTAGTYSATSPTLAAVQVQGLATSILPVSAIATEIVAVNKLNNGATANVLVAPNVNWGGVNSGPLGSIGAAWPIWLPNGAAQNTTVEMLLESNSIAWASDAAGGAISCLGWTDNF